ncbi:hypothetical protein [Microvirga calopogonii]|uniref:hypothetical protein n=1 Tax=Microvirga calopogonii TaxID=2078013 RepID=UPI0013B39A0C|nr:hypothetical protein [Microvirga calopogonii]
MKYLLAKFYYWLAASTNDPGKASSYLDRSHDLDHRADPHHQVEDDGSDEEPLPAA